VGQPDARELLGDRSDIRFKPIGASSHPPGSLDARTRSMGKLNGPFGMRGMIGDVAEHTEMICREAPRALGEIGADAVVADQMEAGGGLVAEHLGLPYASVATALPVNREEGVPPPYVDWPYDRSERGRWWNRGGYRVSDLLMRPVSNVIARHAARFGLSERRSVEHCLSPRLQLAQCVRGIDFPRRELPANFHYLGPFRGADDRAFAIPGDDGRPLVFCSFGTLQGNRVKLFRSIALACAALDLRLLIAHGGRVDADFAATLAGDPIVLDFVPQRAVLARSALAVTHAGFNTVLDALSFGTPILAIPLAFEQPATAARLARAAVARVVRPGAAGPQRLRMEMERLLEEKSYRSAAAAVQAEIASAGGVRRAADLAEAALG
jgi:zeaxanthin glucosyltransferase